MKYSDLPPSHAYRGETAKGEIELKADPSDPLPVIFQNRYTIIVEDPVKFPGGKEGTYLRVFHPEELRGRNGTVMLPRYSGRYVLQRMFRHPVRAWELECPRGFAEPGLEAEENARKEIEEEMGVQVSSLRKLGDICPNTGLLATRAVVFLVELAAMPGEGGRDKDAEAIHSFKAFTKEELMAEIAEGHIRDAFTLGAIAMALAKPSTDVPIPSIVPHHRLEPAPRKHRTGIFIEGFDSILYNTERRGGNQVRFLAEAFYGLIFDCQIVLAEPMVFDNVAVIRLLHRLKDRKHNPLHRVFAYAQFREPQETVAKTLMNPAYVSSCLSPEIEKCRIELARKLASSNRGLCNQWEFLLESLLRENCITEDDELYLSSLLRGVRGGDWLWKTGFAGNPKHGFKMNEELAGWLRRDAARGNHLREAAVGHAPAPLASRIATLVKDPQFWPNGEQPSEAAVYFDRRSRFHQKLSLWRKALGTWDFDRLDEYVNSAYMIAVQRTCLAHSAVRTPMDLNNPAHVAAQQVMQENSVGGTNFEFRLNLAELSGASTSDSPVILQEQFRRVEDGMLDCLNELEKDPRFTQAKSLLTTLPPHDEDYAKRYGDVFNDIVGLVRTTGGPFRLMVEGNRVVTILEDGETQVSSCAREIDATSSFEDANGHESRDASQP